MFRSLQQSWSQSGGTGKRHPAGWRLKLLPSSRGCYQASFMRTQTPDLNTSDNARYRDFIGAALRAVRR